MRIRRHLSYANVVATLALLLALGGGAYAINRVDSRQIVNGTIRSVDLKNRKAVHAADVKRNGLRGKQIDERTLDASRFAPIAGDEAGDCIAVLRRVLPIVSERTLAPWSGRRRYSPSRRWPGKPGAQRGHLSRCGSTQRRELASPAG